MQPIEWYYETAMRWVPRQLEEESDLIKSDNNKEKENEKDSKEKQNNALSFQFKPLSLHYMWSPGR